MIKKVMIAMFVCSNLISMCYGDLAVNEKKDKNGTFFDVKNEFFSIQLSSLGGRIYSLKSYPSGKELFHVNSGHGGALDDRAGRSSEQYDFKVVKKSADEFVIRFSQKSKYGLVMEKQITIHKDLPIIKIDYRLINQSDVEFSYQHMIRNFVAAREATATLNKADTIYYHDIRGIQELNWPKQWFSKTRSEVKVPDMVNPWQAAASKEDKVGLIFYMNEVNSLYFWSKAGGNGFGTLEPTFPTVVLKPGEEKRFSLFCVPFEGLGGISSATKDYLSYLKKNIKDLNLSLTTEFYAISEKFASPHSVRIDTQILDLDRKPVAKAEGRFTASLKHVYSTASSFALPVAGEYIIYQEIKLGDEILGSSETPITVGLPDDYASTYYHPSYKKEREMIDFSIGVDDFEKGYLILQLTDDGEENISVKEIDTDLGIGEQEVIGAELFALTDLGEVNLVLDQGTFPNELKLFIKEERWLEKPEAFKLCKGERQKIYIWLNTHGVKAGMYEANLDVQPENGKSQKLTLKFKVYPVEFPAERKMHLAIFHANLPDIFGALYKSLPEDEWLDMWGKCLEDFRMLGSDVLGVRHGSRDRFAETTTSVTEWKDGYLPVLDLSKWHPYFDLARESGMKHIRIFYGWMAGCWLPEGYKTFSQDKKEEVNIFVLKQIYDFLKPKGFESYYYYFIDEISADKVDDKVRYMRKIQSVIPEMGFGGSGLGNLNAEQLQKLTDLLTWVSPYSSEYHIIKIIDEGKVKLLPNTLRGTQVQPDNSSYAKARITPWYVWKRGIDGIQMYSYTGHTKNYKWCSVSPGKDRPRWSIGLAGFMDGLEDYEYAMMLKDKMERLKKEKKYEQANKIKAVLDHLVGSEEDDMFNWKYITRQSFIYPIVEGTLPAVRQTKKAILELLAE